MGAQRTSGGIFNFQKKTEPQDGDQGVGLKKGENSTKSMEYQINPTQAHRSTRGTTTGNGNSKTRRIKTFLRLGGKLNNLPEAMHEEDFTTPETERRGRDAEVIIEGRSIKRREVPQMAGNTY